MKNLSLFLFVLITSSLFQNCATGTYALSGKTEQFNGRYELPINTTEEKSIENLRMTLTELGFKSTSNYELNFEKSSSKAAGYGLNSFYSNSLTAKVENDNLILDILQTGNYKYGTEEKTNETFEKIKQLYLSKQTNQVK